jgi:hypothetical protein
MNSPDWSRAVWRKSAHSGGNGGCVELTRLDRVNGVRDSKDPHGPALAFAPEVMRAFLDEVKSSKYDL